ncbi:MAG: hypothetical protein AB7P99_07980 [Vicinamibacterales bacterium]
MKQTCAALLTVVVLGLIGSEAAAQTPVSPNEPIVPGVDTPQTAALKRDVKEFELGPFEGIEYKYRVDSAGASFVYEWTATATVKVDFHGEADGTPRGTAQFYQQLAGATSAKGTFIAPAPGIHGWYWENQGADVITVRLVSSGFYTRATEFRREGRTEHEVLEP